MRLKLQFKLRSGTGDFFAPNPLPHGYFSELHLCRTEVLKLWNYLPKNTTKIEVTLKTQEPKMDLLKWQPFKLDHPSSHFLKEVDGTWINIDGSIRDFLREKYLVDKWFWVTVKPVK